MALLISRKFGLYFTCHYQKFDHSIPNVVWIGRVVMSRSLSTIVALATPWLLFIVYKLGYLATQLNSGDQEYFLSHVVLF